MYNHNFFQAAVSSLASILVLMPSNAFAKSPSIRTRVEGNGASNIRQCLRRAANAVDQAGFTIEDIDSDDVEGFNGDYATEVICMSDLVLVLVIVSGPSNSQAGVLRDAIASRL